ncbi:replication-relaxation family protein [Nocardia otitidiscaviarum]|uniref:replication-relaxation family protein n=1 Tax=Nocardia otitidiscaviarum TaxID=1823 RepID=UPI001895EA7E|nr:replication-relaxation family protein [Nocardia otitidiscaviarum]MBF6238704.1 replication-relaxation family protein [Nocardia otitidiscaviarum]
MIFDPTRQPALRNPSRAMAHAQLAERLTARDRWMLRMCHEHRVLTTGQFTALAFSSINFARRRLAQLHDYGVLEKFRPLRTTGSAPAHWVLGPAGAAVLAAEAGVEVHDLRYRPDRALAIAHSLHLAHTLGVNEWFTTLATSPHDEGTLLAWWSEHRCRALWGDLARPDGYGRYTRTGASIDFFLEYDLGTMALPTVAAKLLGYAELARTSAVITPILFWLPSRARENAARKALHDTWTRLVDPDTVPVATAAADLLDPTRFTPADRLWLALDATGTERVALPQLPARWSRVTAATATVPVPPASRHAVLAPPPPRPPIPGGDR